jgi:hypothetical protein
MPNTKNITAYVEGEIIITRLTGEYSLNDVNA